MRTIAIVLFSILAFMRWSAAAQEFQQFSDQFKAQAASDFGNETSQFWKRKSLFVTREYVAHLVQRASNESLPVLDLQIEDQALPLDPLLIQIHSGDLDCSVNHFCRSCDGVKWYKRAFCEGERATCAVALSPIITACAIGKSLNGSELGHIDFSGAVLGLRGEATQFNFVVDPQLASLRAQPNITAAATVNGINAHVHLNTVVGIFAGCPVPPSIRVPSINVATSNAAVPVDATLGLQATPVASPDAVDISVTVNRLSVVADVDTGNVFSWIKNNPTNLITCPLPSLAGFVIATRISRHEFSVLPGPVSTHVGSIGITRAGKRLPIEPQISAKSIGAVEAAANQ